ncbi:hypothetical protein BATDEDRAFT_14566 [Batrachochytrium dendrobatidis JAM81]|uniref:SRP54-type proteins GTP-binding domain-containing protein n=1 Tax=Batrachochytrium dendrobatidis (strain JAM81 / FGSC 10211) TaxID=684364 RepID=F4PCY7_BATDJ|nr:Signal recognition particle receptor subunit alpha [Batrachochytrium dendrobatidis JAM81]EGF76943.1 hypothetical protein BATDEDRAFT_14566 [Batrachochytrium dendrobatidis JAM81]|eukprot:XP_006682360.1 hypothetical protein BATDEDRAFT_14566 [Batrachochytrium dendrobatidis JAM81]
MIDQITILTQGGAVLWTRRLFSTQSNTLDLVNALISNVLLEERAGKDAYLVDPFLLKWTFANEVGLVFVAVHQKVLSLPYIDELLQAIKSTFCSRFKNIIGDISHIDEYAEFDDVFDTILDAVEEKAKEAKVPRSFKESRKYTNTLEGSQQKKSDLAVSESVSLDAASGDPTTQTKADELALKLEKLAKRGVSSRKNTSKKSKPLVSETASPSLAKKEKQMRAWDAAGGSMSVDSNQKLDFSDSKQDSETVLLNLVGHSLGTRSADGSYEALDIDRPAETASENESDDAKDQDSSTAHLTISKSSTSGGDLFSFFSKWVSARTLTEVDLEPALIKIKEHLINKNVAADIASLLCDSVKSGLIGKKTGPFKALNTTIKELMEIALSRILTPSTSTDVLREINAVNNKSHSGNRLSSSHVGRPYTFVFVGVNGVGKSTNLSKICFWLLQNKKRVLIAACDTFRSGAVEQLRVHVKNLKALEKGAVVDLFDRGYGKDPAAIAKEAIAYATLERYDIVLIDTAGRMQDNEPLMRALAKLISTNNPDKILFVGEALVGNGAVDQLTKFNQAFRDFSGMREPRQIDGMILTKFDTIDDKVGAALSMTYATGKPILFVGTGQTYTDLRKLNVRSVVSSLLK